MWRILQEEPEKLTSHYASVINRYYNDPEATYREVLDRYNCSPNGLDLVILSRTCYGGVMRFTKAGKMSTPIGAHDPISPEKFERRVYRWRPCVKQTTFLNQPFETTISEANANDLIYCDPPYLDSQAILYGSQEFQFERLLDAIARSKRRGAKVALSIDGKKKSGKKKVKVSIPAGLFEREVYIKGGSSMLKRFQSDGEIMVGEDVQERLLLTW